MQKYLSAEPETTALAHGQPLRLSQKVNLNINSFLTSNTLHNSTLCEQNSQSITKEIKLKNK